MPIAECQMPNCSAAHARQRVLIRDSANERFYKTKICADWVGEREKGQNSYYVGDYHPVAADVSPRKLGDSRDFREFIGSMLLRRGAQILLTSAPSYRTGPPPPMARSARFSRSL